MGKDLVLFSQEREHELVPFLKDFPEDRRKIGSMIYVDILKTYIFFYQINHL